MVIVVRTANKNELHVRLHRNVISVKNSSYTADKFNI